MKPQTMVFQMQGLGQYLVAENYDEVNKRWTAAAIATENDEPAMVELTNVNGYFPPYRVALNPTVISGFEEAQSDQIAYSEFKTREGWEKWSRETQTPQTGFGS